MDPGRQTSKYCDCVLYRCPAHATQAGAIISVGSILPDPERQAIRERLAKATPGPWKAEGPKFGYFVVRQDPADWDGKGYQQICGMPSLTKHSTWRVVFAANADLIAHAPSDLAALLAENDRLISEVTELRERDHVISKHLEDRATARDPLAQSLIAETDRLRAALDGLAVAIERTAYLEGWADGWNSWDTFPHRSVVRDA
jgi:hypothetical protein